MLSIAMAMTTFSLSWLVLASSTLSLFLTVRIEAFSPSINTASSSSSSRSKVFDFDVRSTSRISQLKLEHYGPLFSTTSATATVTSRPSKGATATPSSPPSATSPVGTKTKSKNARNKNNNKKRSYHNYKKYKRKGPSKSKSSNNSKKKRPRKVLTNIPHTDLTIDELKQLTEYHLSQNIQPHGTTSIGTMSSHQMHEFSRLMSSWSKLNTEVRQEKILAAEMTEQCLLELIEEKKAGNANAEKGLTGDLYHLVIKAWLKSGNYKDLIHASSLLDLMERIHPVASKKDEISQRFVASSMKCYVAVLDRWCKSRSIGAEVKAEEVLNRMGRVGKKIGKDDRDVKHYNNVMNRIATSGKANAGEEAERLLEELIATYKKHEEENENGGDNSTSSTVVATSSKNALVPNRNSFNTVIKAYANAGGKRASTNAQRILSMMEDPSSFGLQSISEQIMPDKISYTSILMAQGSSSSTSKHNNHHHNAGFNGDSIGNSENDDDENAGEKAEQILERMVEMYQMGNWEVRPDTVTYNAVLKVWGKCGHPNAGERSEILLDKMLELYEAGDTEVIPDDVTFNTAIHNIANSHTLDSPKRAMTLLERMEQCHETGLIEARPDIISYNSVLNAFAKKGGPESAQQAEDMLDNLERSYDSGVWNIRPDVYSYNIVISTWGNCGNANKAVALLDRMTAKTNQGKADLKPDVTTYNSVLHAWSQSSDRNAPVKALGLLEIMLRLHESGDRSARPDVQSFSTVINAFSKSKFPRKARQTRDLLRRMKHLYENGQRNMKPNVYVYAAVLNACAYTFGRAEEKEEALKVGIETYEALQSSPEIQTNHVVYGSFIRVCRRLMPDDSRRNHFITRAFKQCCSDGQLGEYVLRQLRAVPKLYETLLQAYIVDDEGEAMYRDLPSSWKCNVQDRKRRKGQGGNSSSSRRSDRSRK